MINNMIKHIIKQIFNQYAANTWLWIELFLVTIFLWLTVDNLYVSVKNYYTPTGFDISHTYLLSFGGLNPQSAKYISQENKKTTTGEDMLTILDRVKKYNGIESACLSSYNSFPYSGGYMGTMYKNGSLSVQFQHRIVSPDFFKVFKITTPDGQIDPLLQALRQPKAFIITEDAQTLFVGKGKSAIGLSVISDSNDSISKKVSCVSASIRRGEFQKPYPCCFTNIEESDLADKTREDLYSDLALSIRVTPEADHDFIMKFKKEMNSQLKVGNTYLKLMVSFENIQKSYYNFTKDLLNLKNRIAVASFLLINIFLGIIGTFWFRTAYRKSEMGLRIALGSTRAGLRKNLVIEGIILLTLAVIPASIICLNIGYAELIDISQLDFTFTRFLSVMLITYLLMSAMIILGIWYPARQAMKVQPAEVLHEQ